MPLDTPGSRARHRLAGALLPVTIIAALLVLLVPLPAPLLDLLLAANITLAVLVLLTVLSIRSPIEFSTFPTILLTTTFTRLVLNVASTRLILTQAGNDGLDAAGGVIRAFGEFVAGDQILVGVVMFAIIIVIQFVVITKGSTRISEVAARFMLDGLPGRQMAIDADLHAGLIEQAEASKRREDVYRQADFFGAMDGAGKYVRGDALAGMVITVVNILGGLYMGIVVQGMELSEALGVFTKLTIGDGLVSQVPAFLTSLAAGLIVTRSNAETDLSRDVSRQLLGRPEVLGGTSVLLALLALTGLPQLPLFTLAGSLLVGAIISARRPSSIESTEPNETPKTPEPTARPQQPAEPAAPSDRIDDLLQVEPLEFEIGYRLIGVADPARGGDLLERVREVRQRVARELGLIVPHIRVRDQVALGPFQYRVNIRGATVGQGIAYVGRLLAIPPAALMQKPDGREGVDPVSGQPAVWIHADGREVAELAGCRVVEAAAVLAGHFHEIVLAHADDLLTYEQVRMLLDRVRASSPGIVEDVVPTALRLGEVRRVLQNLVRERVSIRDGETILEALAEHAGRTRDPGELTEQVRRALGRQIVQPYCDSDGRLWAATAGAALEHSLVERDALRPMSAAEARRLVKAIAVAVSPLVEQGRPPVLLAGDAARPILRDLTRHDLPRLAVLGRGEVARDVAIELVGSVTLGESDSESAEPNTYAPATTLRST